VLFSLFSVALAMPTLVVEPLVAGEVGTIQATGMTPGDELVLIGTGLGQGVGPCIQGVCTDLLDPRRVGSAIADDDGVATVTFSQPRNRGGKTATYQGIVFATGTVTPTVQAVIAEAPAVVERSLDEADAVLSGLAGDEVGSTYSLSVGDVDGASTLLVTGVGVAFAVPDGDLGGSVGDPGVTRFEHGSAQSAFLGAADLDGDGDDEAIIGSGGFESSLGAIYIYEDITAGTLLPADASATLLGTTAGGLFANAGSVGGDTDGDGREEIAACAPIDDVVSVHRGGVVGTVAPFPNAAVTIQNQGCTAVAIIDDLSGDGIDDIVVGDFVSGIAAGEARVFLSPFPATLDSSDAVAVFEGDNFDGVGAMVAPAGDLDGDGLAEFLVGAPAGFVYVMRGSARGTMDAVDGALAWVEGDGETGFAARMADLNGDDVLDLLVSAQGNDEVYGFYGPLLGGYDLGEADILFTADAGDNLGATLTTHDVDGDGIDDVLLGSPHRDADGVDSGAVSVFFTSGF